MLKVVLIGVGSFGKKILNKIESIPYIEVIDKISSSSSWENIPNNIDWVIISTPTEFHYEQVKYFLNKGINVFVEKPCTLSYNSTKELIELSKLNNVKLYIDDILIYDKIDLSSNTFIYKKWSTPNNNIVDRIVYHHLYLLYKPGLETYTNLSIIKNDPFNKHFIFTLGGINYEFIYDLHYYKEKIHNIITNSEEDALTNMFISLFNNDVSYEDNHNRSLFATKLAEDLKKELYGKVAVIGGGVYGITSAIKLRDNGFEVDLYEKEDDLLKAASGINQYRVHRGYHYPRSVDTIHSCRDNEILFLKYYNQSILKNNIKHLYAISKENSLTSATEYLKILDKNQLEWKLEENIPECDLTVEVKEHLYDPNILKTISKNRLYGNGVNIKLNTPWDKKLVNGYNYVIYATYASLNEVTNEKHNYQFELCEKPLFKLPENYKNKSIVIMDGPFMCFDPYSDTEYHLAGNVVHAIHIRNIGPKPEIPDVYKEYLNKGIIKNPKYTNVDRFIQSAKQFFPDIEQAEHIGSMYTIRTVLPNTDDTDERPTIVRKLDDKQFVIFSGKIVNCVDAANKLIKAIYE